MPIVSSMKYYPPFKISRITQEEDTTTVVVQFYSIPIGMFKQNMVIKNRGDGKEPHAINASFGGTLDRIETYTLSKMTADEARATIYKQLEDSGKHEKV